jgi:apolipoprotein D and lipocalin family protein
MRISGKCVVLFGVLLATAAACARDLPPIQPVAHVDLPRFMGSWYVIASIPTRVERDAYNAIETYTLQSDGEVATTFRFNDGASAAPVKTIRSVGIVKANTGNAVWGIQLFWPLKAQYIVAYVSRDYGETIVARDARDYAWIMTRTPAVSEEEYAALVDKVRRLGYDVEKIRRVPQRPPGKPG